MVTVRFLPDNRSASIEQGSTILEAARQAGVLIEAPCNGAGHCAKCLVRLPGDDLANVVVHVDAPVDAGPDMVLACHSHVFGDVTVETVQREETGLQVQCAGQAGDVDLLPYITKNYHAGADRTAVLAGDRLLGFEQGDTTTATYGLVVDIGTTTLVAAVVDLNSGAELAGASRLNPQSLHAQDVLSRIRFAADGGLEVLHRELIRELNAIIAEAASAATIPADRIYEAVFSGNTCMLHLAAGIDPAPLGRHPFTLVIRGGCHIGASDIGLAIAPAGIVYLPGDLGLCGGRHQRRHARFRPGGPARKHAFHRHRHERRAGAGGGRCSARLGHRGRPCLRGDEHLLRHAGCRWRHRTRGTRT